MRSDEIPGELAMRREQYRSREMILSEERREMELYQGGYGAGQPEEIEDDEINLLDLWRVVVRRRWMIFGITAIVVAVVMIGTFLVTPIYRSTVVIQIEREASKVTQYQTVTPQEAVNSNDFYQTQYELLKSRTLAKRVIDQLGLANSSQFAGKKKKSLFSDIKASIKDLVSSSNRQIQDLPPDLATIFEDSLTVAPIKRSRLVKVSFDSPDPVLAARVTNAVANDFIKTTLERRFDASSYAKNFLASRIKQVRAALDDSEKKLSQYLSEKGIISLKKQETILSQKMQQLSSRLVEVEADRVKTESKYRQTLLTKDNGILEILADPVIQELKNRRAKIMADYETNRKIYRPAYPKMVQLQSQIDKVGEEISRQAKAIRGAIKNNYQVKLREEADLRKRVAETKQVVLALRINSTDRTALERNVETNRVLYSDLLKRLKEVGVESGSGTNNISIVDPAEVPRKAHSPKLRLNLLLALVGGLFGGVMLAFLLESLDDTIKGSEELANKLNLPVLGIIPEVEVADADIGKSVALTGFRELRSAMAEANRSLRTALLFSTADGSPKILHMTSASESEGKSTTAVGSAVAFAMAGNSVLLIDADLRNPSLHQEFSMPNNIGLTNYLAGDVKPADLAQPSEIKGLFVVPAGPCPPNPAELLSSGKMLNLLKLGAERFDQVIVDGPPVLGLADALILSSLADGTLLIVNAGVARFGMVQAALKRLRQARAPLIGAVLAKYGQGSSGYGYDYKYNYNNYYSYQGEGNQHAAIIQERAG
ncbi:MAG TPA: polysaccharide biosynthesis tyrosine autokinase [Gammaproteobacteria bacterium]|nr:polysaccharide biosynthesis tyrosine autokinase [Gammaproteobacteria bacterium]